MSRHIVLAGDSVFDNASYVPGEECVIDQLKTEMPSDWKATLLARDGDMIADVGMQLMQLPDDATDIVVSVGGNDALRHADILDRVTSANELEPSLASILPAFGRDYGLMLDELLGHRRRAAICTIYDQCPFEVPRWRELVPRAIHYFNQCISTEAAKRNVPVINLCEVCVDPEDFSNVSPIEPSSLGGLKIVFAIIRQLRYGNETGDRAPPCGMS